jgi:predicted NBD/HSP70 family sugar kinase
MTSSPAPGTPGWLAQRNDQAALALLLDEGPLTRNRLGELTGLSKPTAAQIVARLEEAGLIRAAGELSAGRGPNAVTYDVRLDRTLGVAIDVDETVLRAAVVDPRGTQHPVATLPIEPGRPRTAEDDVRRAIEAACAAAAADPAAIVEIVIGVQAATDLAADRLNFTDTLDGWPMQNPRGALEAGLGLGVTLENDVNLAAIAERAEGAGADAAGFALLWLGEGLGLSIDLDGSIHHGATGGAGEIGYLPAPRSAMAIDPDAEDLQELVGGSAVARSASAALGRPLDYAAALAALAAGPEPILPELAARIAFALTPVIAVLDPSLVILGGPTGVAGGAALADAVSAALRASSGWDPVVRTTGAPTDAVLLGARHVLISRLRARLLPD